MSLVKLKAACQIIYLFITDRSLMSIVKKHRWVPATRGALGAMSPRSRPVIRAASPISPPRIFPKAAAPPAEWEFVSIKMQSINFILNQELQKNIFILKTRKSGTCSHSALKMMRLRRARALSLRPSSGGWWYFNKIKSQRAKWNKKKNIPKVKIPSISLRAGAAGEAFFDIFSTRPHWAIRASGPSGTSAASLCTSVSPLPPKATGASIILVKKSRLCHF